MNIPKGGQIQICTLSYPAKCEHRIDGKFSHIILCGGNKLSGEVKECPYRKNMGIKENSRLKGAP